MYCEGDNGAFHTGSARGSVRILSRAQAEPLVWTPCGSDQKFQAYTQNLSRTLFTLETQVKLSSGSARKFLNRAPSRVNVKCPNVLDSIRPSVCLSIWPPVHQRTLTQNLGQRRFTISLICLSSPLSPLNMCISAGLEKKVREMHALYAKLEEEKYDWELKIRNQEYEVTLGLRVHSIV